MDAKLEQKARELLREAYAKRGWLEMPAFLRVDSKLSDQDEIAIEAITRALQAQPAEGGVGAEKVEAAAKRIYYIGCKVPPEDEDEWQSESDTVKDHCRRMARAALAAPKPATTTGEGVGNG